MRWLAVTAWLGLALVGVAGIRAEAPVAVDERTPRIDLIPHIAYLKDSSNTLALTDAMAEPVASRFQPSAWKATPNFGFTSATHWFRFRVVSRAAVRTSWYVAVNRPRLDRIGFYVVEGTRVVRRQEVGNAFPDAPRDVSVRPFVFELTLDPGAEAKVYMAFRSEAALWIPLSLQSPSVFWPAYLREELWNLLFFGYMLALTIVATFMAIAARDKAYVFYTFTTITFVGYLFCFMQYPVFFNLPGFTFWGRKGILFLAGLSGPGFLYYTRYFLDLPQRAPRLDRFMRWAAWGLWGAGLAVLPASYTVLAQTSTVLNQICIVIGFAVSALYAVRGHRIATLYMAAWSVCLLALLLRTAAVFGWMSSWWVGDFFVQCSTMLGYTLFLLALGDRIRQMDRDKLAAQAQSLVSQKAVTLELERKLKAETEMHRQRETFLRDVHDGVGGIMANLRMMSGLAHAVSDVESMRDMINRMDALTAEGVTEVRSLMSALDVKAPDWMIVESEFRRYGHLVLEPHGIALTVSADLGAVFPGISVSHFIGLYRLYKEALANIVKHAQARSVTVELSSGGGSASDGNAEGGVWVRLTITDDGTGMPAETTKGRGMRNMEARIRELGGTMDVRSADPGLCLVFRLPLAPG